MESQSDMKSDVQKLLDSEGSPLLEKFLEENPENIVVRVLVIQCDRQMTGSLHKINRLQKHEYFCDILVAEVKSEPVKEDIKVPFEDGLLYALFNNAIIVAHKQLNTPGKTVFLIHPMSVYSKDFVYNNEVCPTYSRSSDRIMLVDERFQRLSMKDFSQLICERGFVQETEEKYVEELKMNLNHIQFFPRDRARYEAAKEKALADHQKRLQEKTKEEEEEKPEFKSITELLRYLMGK